jgi:chemotaxis protein MotB
MGGGQKISQGDDSKENAMKPRAPTEDEIQQAAMAEKEQLESLMEALKKAIEASQALKPFTDQLLLDITSEGLRIQIVDKKNRPMFDSGSAELKGYTKEILHELAKTINTVPNRISLTGHTDATRFVSREKKNYSNWELSADRANASRRELVVGGLANEKIVKVVGLASMVLFNKAEPRHPINRRIAIIVMNKAAEKALFGEGSQVSSGAEGEQLIKSRPAKQPKQIADSIPVNKTPAAKPAAPASVTRAKPAPQKKTKPASPAKPEPAAKVRPEPVKKARPEPKKASHKADLPPAQKSDQQFINIPSPIAPINPIQLP